MMLSTEEEKVVRTIVRLTHKWTNYLGRDVTEAEVVTLCNLTGPSQQEYIQKLKESK